MNTKQKLTLGIAAIFMVTLTVIGVTYAYFVTRVNYTGTETTAVIQTATIGSSFHADEDTIVLNNAIPGTMGWKTFYVDSGSTQPVPFQLRISTSLNVKPDLLAAEPDKTDWDVTTDASPAFIHSSLVDATDLDDPSQSENYFDVDGVYPKVGKLTGTCYMSDDAAKAYTDKTEITEARSGCYNANTYNNIEVTIYRIMPEDYILDAKADGSEDDVLGTGEDFKGELVTSEKLISGSEYELTLQSGRTVKANVITAGAGYAKGVKAPFNNSFSTAFGAIDIGDMQEVAAKAQESDPDNYNLYVIKVEYINRNLNQNLENDASVSVKIDITGTASITQ